jgi:predicted PurR-regulated permease PerM
MQRVEEGQTGESTMTFAEREAASSRTFFARIGVVLLSAGLLYLVARIVAPLWQPLVWAVLIGSLLAPLNQRLSARLGNRPQLAASLSLLGVLLLFLLPLTGLAGAVAAQAAQLLQGLDEQGVQLGSTIDLRSIPMLERPLHWIEATVGIPLAQVQAWFVAGSKRLLQAVASSGGAVMLGALGTVFSFVLMLFVLFFVLRDGPALAHRTMRLLPIEERLRSRLWRHLIDVTRAVFMGIGLTAIVQGALLGAGFFFAGVPSWLVFGVLAMLFALVPFVGTAILWIPAAIWLAARGHPGAALFIAGWGILVVGSVDNFLRPFLISGRVEVPTLAVFIGVMGGLAAFGFIGLFLGPIVLGLLVALFRFATEDLGLGQTRA